jgi:hypothetical protein
MSKQACKYLTDSTLNEQDEALRPITPDIEQMREEPDKERNHESILYVKDITVEEEYPTYAQDSPEYIMHWH